MKKMLSRKRWDKHQKIILLLLILILMVQAAMMIYYGSQKSAYHVDEILTFELANWQDGFSTRTEGVIDNWQSGDFYADVLTLTGDERFDYSMVYKNQVSDVHPPLYYYMIHTVSALLPGAFSKWIGIVPNIIFCLLIALVLFFVAKRVSGNDYLALIATAAWAFSIGAMDTAMFIRMYAMLTFFCVLMVLLHLRALDETAQGKLTWKSLVPLFFCTVGGILTQYYFLIFCFFLCGLVFFGLLATKQWSTLWKYVAVEFGAVICSVLYYPALITHMFSGYRGTEALSNLANVEGYLEVLKKIGSIIGKDLFNGWTAEFVVLVAAVLLVVVVNRLFLHIRADQCEGGITLRFHLHSDVHLSTKGTVSISKETLLLLMLAITALGYFVLVAKIVPYHENRYFMCIFPLLSLVLALSFYRIVRYIARNSRIGVIAALVLILAVTGASHQMQNVGYLYKNYAQRTESLSSYSEYPVIMLNGKSYNNVDTWLAEFQQYPAIYRCDCQDYSGLANAAATGDLSEGFLLYAEAISLNDDELFAEVEKYIDIATREKLTSIGCRVYYCTVEGAQ